MAWSSGPQFFITHHAVVPLVTCRNSDRVDQIVVQKSCGFPNTLVKKLHVTNLAGHLGVGKLTHALFQRVWRSKLYEIVTSFVYLCTTCVQENSSTAVPLGLLQPLPLPESCFSSWCIGFTTNLPLSHRCSTISTCIDHTTKYTSPIPSKVGD